MNFANTAAGPAPGPAPPAATAAFAATQPNDTRHSSIGSASSIPGHNYRGYAATHPHVNHGLSKIETSGLPIDLSGGLRTAPVYGSFDFGGLGEMFVGYGSTVNPAQLHFGRSPQPFGSDIPASPFSQPIQDVEPVMDDDFNLDWINGLDPFLVLGNNAESAIDQSSPSAISTESQSGFSEQTIDGANHIPMSSSSWSNPFSGPAPMPTTTQFAMDFSSPAFNEVMYPQETASPKSLMASSQFNDSMYGVPASMAPLGQSALGGHSQSMFPSFMATSGESPNILNTSFAPNNATPVHSLAGTFTDYTRQALLASILQPVGLNNHRKYSQPVNSNMFSGEVLSRAAGFNNTSQLPCTADMQRYISSYVSYFHPHLPFLHIPTLDFQAPEFTSDIQTPSGHLNLCSDGVAGGAGCLILSIAAVGALYALDGPASRNLQEASKKMIQLYLEERQKVDKSVALNRVNHAREDSAHNIPLWLIQAMLLNVIYGHASGDKMSSDIASNHFASLVSLARAADLTRHMDPKNLPRSDLAQSAGAHDNGLWGFSAFDVPRERKDWLNWKTVEERKRTLYAILTVSSFLVTTYNYAPALANSEIQLDLPCEEDVWAAESPQAWKKLGGPSVSKQSLSFPFALKVLLTASQREQAQLQPSNFPFRPSPMGCLVLILALHNYIWETRQQHIDRNLTTREADAMQAHIEPALRAWQAAWASNPAHSLERPNPYGAGPLFADCIPLLDLAYIRLFVNVGLSREAYSQQNWDAMADEFAHGSDLFCAEEVAPVMPGHFGRHNSVSDLADLSISGTPTEEQAVGGFPTVSQLSQSARERQLRKAAFYAADSMTMADELGNMYFQSFTKELPIQSALCTFDCGQVLAEWICTVQERVGPYLGILGRDEVNLREVPDVLLENEDRKLVEKIKDILERIESKMRLAVQNGCSGASHDVLRRFPSAVEGGYGSKLTVATSYLLDQYFAWTG